MIALIQRVSHASVAVDGALVGAIERGILAFIGVAKGDGEAEAARLVERVLDYRIFPDDSGRMNLALRDIVGGLLLVPQFTLAADTAKGTRASFTPAAAPADGERLFSHALTLARAAHPTVACGRFGADMQVSLTNDGPVTFWLEVRPRA